MILDMSEKEQEGNDLSIYWKPAFGQRIHEMYGRSLEDLESPQFHTFVKALLPTLYEIS